MTDVFALEAASERELGCWHAVVEAYGALETLLEADDADPAALGAARERTEVAVAALRAARETLGPVRLAGHPVPEPVATLWRAAANAAVTATDAHARCLARARARQEATAARLAGLTANRRGLTGYRPLAVRAPLTTQVA